MRVANRLPYTTEQRPGRKGEPEETSAPPTPTDVGAVPAGTVQVISGAGVQSFPLANTRLADARVLLARILRVDERATALVNGRPTRNNQLLASGDTLEFVHESGEKG